MNHILAFPSIIIVQMTWVRPLSKKVKLHDRPAVVHRSFRRAFEILNETLGSEHRLTLLAKKYLD